MLSSLRMLFPWLAPQFSPEEQRIVNAALAAYVRSFPVPERLAEYLQANCPPSRQTTVEREVVQVIRDAESYLFAQRKGVHWDPQSAERYFNHLQRRYRWLSRASHPTVISYGQWLCMHEGLNA